MTDISIRLKRLGKKRLHTVPVTISDEVKTLEDLIRSCVAGEVGRFNASRTDPTILPFLSPAEIQSQANSGKVGFGDLANTDEVNLEEATSIALQGWKDGLFLVFIDDDEIKDLNAPLSLTEGSNVTFMRMTFLTGTYW
ncbi:MAG: hypothetical protein AB8H12_17320 [Lewinella sp.]